MVLSQPVQSGLRIREEKVLGRGVVRRGTERHGEAQRGTEKPDGLSLVFGRFPGYLQRAHKSRGLGREVRDLPREVRDLLCEVGDPERP